MMTDLGSVSSDSQRLGVQAYWNPMWECMRMVAQNIASVTGFRDPAANGAIVRGMSAAENVLDGSVSWTGIGSEGIDGEARPFEYPVVATVGR